MASRHWLKKIEQWEEGVCLVELREGKCRSCTMLGWAHDELKPEKEMEGAVVHLVIGLVSRSGGWKDV